MTRFQRIAAAAAVLFAAGGITVVQSWKDANTADIDPFTDKGLHRKLRQLDDRSIEVFLLQDLSHFPPTTFVPVDATGERWLGECLAGPGTCTLARRGADYIYERRLSEAFGAHKLVLVRAHPYFVGGWKKYAADNVEVDFLGRRRDVQSACVTAGLTALQCRNLQHDLDPCWAGANANAGLYQRNGRIYGPGQGGTAAATTPTVAEVDSGDWLWNPCVVRQGQDPRRVAEAAVPPDSELELDPEG